MVQLREDAVTCSTRGVAITCEPLATVTYDAIAQYVQAVHVWDEGTFLLRKYDHVQVYTEEGGGLGMMMGGGSDQLHEPCAVSFFQKSALP